MNSKIPVPGMIWWPWLQFSLAFQKGCRHAPLSTTLWLFAQVPIQTNRFGNGVYITKIRRFVFQQAKHLVQISGTSLVWCPWVDSPWSSKDWPDNFFFSLFFASFGVSLIFEPASDFVVARVMLAYTLTLKPHDTALELRSR